MSEHTPGPAGLYNADGNFEGHAELLRAEHRTLGQLKAEEACDAALASWERLQTPRQEQT